MFSIEYILINGGIDSAHPPLKTSNTLKIPWNLAAIPVQRISGYRSMLRACLQLLLNCESHCMQRIEMVMALQATGFTAGGPKTPVMKGLHSHISQLSTRSPIRITSNVLMIIERMKDPKIGRIYLQYA